MRAHTHVRAYAHPHLRDLLPQRLILLHELCCMHAHCVVLGLQLRQLLLHVQYKAQGHTGVVHSTCLMQGQQLSQAHKLEHARQPACPSLPLPRKLTHMHTRTLMHLQHTRGLAPAPIGLTPGSSTLQAAQPAELCTSWQRTCSPACRFGNAYSPHPGHNPPLQASEHKGTRARTCSRPTRVDSWLLPPLLLLPLPPPAAPLCTSGPSASSSSPSECWRRSVWLLPPDAARPCKGDKGSPPEPCCCCPATAFGLRWLAGGCRTLLAPLLPGPRPERGAPSAAAVTTAEGGIANTWGAERLA